MSCGTGHSKIALRASALALIVLAIGATSAHASYPQYWCAPTGTASPPCVESATLNGSPLLVSDPNFSIQLVPFTNGGYHSFAATIENSSGGADLGSAALSDTFSVVVDTGTLVPRVASSQGSNMSFTRTPEAGGTYEITITGSPTTLTDNSECTWPSGGLPSCPFEATKEFTAYLSTQVSDYEGWPIASDIASFYGMNLSTNIAETGLPPQLEPDPSTPGADQLVIDLANQHELPGGATFYGFFHMTIPSSFLQAVYGIDDPSTVTDTGLAASVGAGGGTVTITVAPGGSSLQLDITGLTFTTRVLRIARGVITPTSPGHVSARRTAPTRGRISFRAAKPRGSRINDYVASCTATKGHTKAAGKSAASPITVKGLRVAKAYRCTVWAASKAGAGKHSAAAVLPA